MIVYDSLQIYKIIDVFFYCRHLRNRNNGVLLPPAENVETELDCFLLFMSEDIISKMCIRTNRVIDTLLHSMTPDQRKAQSYVRNTTVSELKAFFGLMILRGTYKWNYMDVCTVWKLHPVFSATMSVHRFYFLSKRITFDDPATRDERWLSDRACAVREFVEELNDNLGGALQAGNVSNFSWNISKII